MPPYDLAVIGGGPAGATAAWTAARRGLRVVLLERGEFPRDKVCGEFFSAEALPQLNAMAPALAVAAPEIATAVFVSPGGRRAEFRLPQPARGLSRLALDAALWRAAGEAGATLRSHAAVTGVAQDGAVYRLSVAAGGEIAADALIVAAGRWWAVPGLGAPVSPRPSPWLGAKARFRGLQAGSAVEMYCFRGGYCGLSPVENGWTNACCLIHRHHICQEAGDLGVSRDFAAWIARAVGTPALTARLRGGEQATATVVTAPVEVGPRAAILGNALLAGDASGFIDPFTGDGMARAMLSGRLAAECIGHPQRYAEAVARAARPAYRASAGLRAVVNAPAWLQSAVLWAFARPAFGPRLVAATRWRTL